jgi:ATP-dependent protease ClpP protease subunit
MAEKFESIVTPNKGSKYEISIWDSLDNYEDYDELLKTMQKIGKEDTVTLNISTPGGRCDIGFMLIDRYLLLKAMKCRIDIEVPYPTYSMGAIMALCGRSLEMKPGSFLMFHDYSDGRGRSKGNEIFKSTEAYREVFAYRFKNICQPFLTDGECEDVLEGKDLYIKWNDKSLSTRLKRHFK